MELFFVGLVFLIGGYVIGVKITSWATKQVMREKDLTQAIDRSNYLQTLRRELANLLIWRDPQRYLKLFKELSAELAPIKFWRLEEVQRRLSELCKKYPNYIDFDAIQSREYVLYPDGICTLSYDELEAHYRDIVTFVELSIASDPLWKSAYYRGSVFSFTGEHPQKAIEHLSEYMERIEDTKLIFKIDQAMEAYYMQRDEKTGRLDNEFFSVQPIYRSTPDYLYGIHLKRTNEFAIYSNFVFDDGRTSESRFRSDVNFETQDLLFANDALLEEIKNLFELSSKINHT